MLGVRLWIVIIVWNLKMVITLLRSLGRRIYFLKLPVFVLRLIILDLPATEETVFRIALTSSTPVSFLINLTL